MVIGSQCINDSLDKDVACLGRLYLVGTSILLGWYRIMSWYGACEVEVSVHVKLKYRCM